MEPKSKKAKWEEIHGCIKIGTSAVCTLCNDSITARTYNVERYFLTKHKNSLSTMMEDEKLEHIKKCVMQYTQQKSSLQQFVVKHHPSTKSSFIASLKMVNFSKIHF